MKTRQTLICSFFTVILALAFTTCGDDGGGKINTRFIFGNKAPPASLSVAQPSRSIMNGTTWDEESFSPLNKYYDSLNDLVRSYTPTEFSVFLHYIYVLTDGNWQTLYTVDDSGGDIGDLTDDEYAEWIKRTTENSLVDFVNSFTFTPTYELTAGSTTTAIYFATHFGGMEYALKKFADNDSIRYVHAKFTFALDDNVESDHWLRGEIDEIRLLARDGNKVSVLASYFLPKYNEPPNMEFFFPGIFYYNGTEYKCAYHRIPVDTDSMGLKGKNYSLPFSGGLEAVFIPMNTLQIPSDATGVDIEVNWDLTNIIEQYQGDDNLDDTYDDVFILARDFWQRLSLNVIIR